MGRGFGSGFGRVMGAAPQGAAETIEGLKAYAEELRSELKEIEQRIKELERQ